MRAALSEADPTVAVAVTVAWMVVLSVRLSVNVPEDDEPLAIVTRGVTEAPPVWVSVTVIGPRR